MTAAFWETTDDEQLAGSSRIRWRVIARLAKAGTVGMNRKALRGDAGSRYRKAFLAELPGLMRDGIVEDVSNVTGKYRLTPQAVNLIRRLDPAMAAEFPVLDPSENFWEPPEFWE